MAFSISYIYSISDKYSSKLAKIRKSTDRFTSSAKKAATKVKTLTTGMANLKNIASAAAIGMAAIFPIKKAMDFEFAMADVLKVLGDITPEQMKILRKEAFAVSVAMGRLPKDITAVVAAGGRLKIPVEQLANFTRLATKTAVAFEINEEVAGDALASMKSKLVLTITETENLMDAVNHMADNTAAKAGRMIEIMGRLSPTMASIKMPPEQVAGWAALADIVEVTPMKAASGMRMMLRTMKTKLGLMGELLKAPTETITEMLKVFAKIPEAVRPEKLLKLFGAEATDFVEGLVLKIGLLDETLGLVSDKTKVAGSMQRELEKKMSTATFKVNQARSAFEVLSIVIGTPFLPLVKKAAHAIIKIGERLKVFAEAHPSLSRFALILGIAIAAFTGIAIATGIAATVLSGFAAPILIVFGLITALVGAFTLWTGKNVKLKAAILKLWNAVKVLLEPFMWLWKLSVALFKAIAPGISFVDVLAGSISVLADALKFVLSPFKALIDFSKQLARGNIMGALGAGFSALQAGSAALMPKSLGGTAGAMPLPQSVAAQNARATAGTLNGNIMVSADAPARVKRAEMETDMPGDLGFNLAPAQ